MQTEMINIPWLKKQNLKYLVDDAKKCGLKNIKEGWPSHQAVFKASCSTLGVSFPSVLLRMLSGFGEGIARSGGTCGALCGGVAALGYLFGRNETYDFGSVRSIIDNDYYAPSEKIQIFEGMFVSNYEHYCSLFNMFKSKFGSTECRDLISYYYPDIISRDRFYFCHTIISETSGFVMKVAINKALGENC